MGVRCLSGKVWIPGVGEDSPTQHLKEDASPLGDWQPAIDSLPAKARDT